MAQEDRITGLVGYSGAKVPVLVATTADITLNGLQTIDGTALAQDDRVLVKNQTDTTENGIWVADTGDWNRAPDCDGPYDLAKGSLIFVTDGATNGTNWFYCTTTDPVPDGSMAIAFAKSSTALAVISAFWQGVVSLATATLSRAALGLYDPLATGSAISAKGDLLVGTAAATVSRLAVGADGRIPMARSGAATGLAYVAALSKGITGLTWANNAVDATNDIDFASGGCMDSTGALWIDCAAMTKQLDANWAPGSAAGMRNSGAAIANTDYYLYAVAKADGTQDYYAHVSSVVATVLTALQAESGGASYVYARMIGWIKRTAGAIVAFNVYETEGGGVEYAWGTPAVDINLAGTLTTTRRTDALRVPLNFSVVADISAYLFDAAAPMSAYIWCPDRADVGAATGPSTGNITVTFAGDWSLTGLRVRTSSAGLIASRCSVATADQYQVSTLGFLWARRN